MGAKRRKYVKAEDLRREQRRTIVSRFYLRGWTQTEIAGKLKRTCPRCTGAEPRAAHTCATQRTVSNDIQAIEREWVMQRASNLEASKQRAISVIDQEEAEAWEAWDRSKQPSKQVTSRELQTGVDPKTGEPVVLRGKQDTVLKEQTGDPRYLQIVNECEDRRAKILGTYAAQRHSHIDYTKLTDEQLERIRQGEDPEVVLATSGRTLH